MKDKHVKNKRQRKRQYVGRAARKEKRLELCTLDQGNVSETRVYAQALTCCVCM
jgi:hypothetical protein